MRVQVRRMIPAPHRLVMEVGTTRPSIQHGGAKVIPTVFLRSAVFMDSVKFVRCRVSMMQTVLQNTLVTAASRGAGRGALDFRTGIAFPTSGVPTGSLNLTIHLNRVVVL